MANIFVFTQIHIRKLAAKARTCGAPATETVQLIEIEQVIDGLSSFIRASRIERDDQSNWNAVFIKVFAHANLQSVSAWRARFTPFWK